MAPTASTSSPTLAAILDAGSGLVLIATLAEAFAL